MSASAVHHQQNSNNNSSNSSHHRRTSLHPTTVRRGSMPMESSGNDFFLAQQQQNAALSASWSNQMMMASASSLPFPEDDNLRNTVPMAPPPQRELAIFWDYENVPLPSWCNNDPTGASNAIVQRLGHLGRIVDRRLYFDFDSVASAKTDRLWSGLDASGFALVNTPRRGFSIDRNNNSHAIRKETLDKKLIADVLTFAWDSAVRSKDTVKPCVVLLTSDGDYAYTLNRLRDRGVTTVVIFQTDRVAPILTSSADLPLRLEQDILKYLPNNPHVSPSLTPKRAKETLNSSSFQVPPSSLILPICSPGRRGRKVVGVSDAAAEIPLPIAADNNHNDNNDRSHSATDKTNLVASILCVAVDETVVMELNNDDGEAKEGWFQGRSCARAYRATLSEWEDFFASNLNDNGNTVIHTYQKAKKRALELGWIETGHEDESGSVVGSRGDASSESHGGGADGAINDSSTSGGSQWLRLTQNGNDIVREMQQFQHGRKSQRKTPSPVGNGSISCSATPETSEESTATPTQRTELVFPTNPPKSTVVSSCWVYVGNLGPLRSVKELVSVILDANAEVEVERAYCSESPKCAYVRVGSETQVAKLVESSEKNGLMFYGRALKIEPARNKQCDSFESGDPNTYFNDGTAVNGQRHADLEIVMEALKSGGSSESEWHGSSALIQVFRAALGVGRGSQSSKRLRKALKLGSNKQLLEFARREGKDEYIVLPLSEEVMRMRCFYFRALDKTKPKSRPPVSMNDLYCWILHNRPCTLPDGWVENGLVLRACQNSYQRFDDETKAELRQARDDLIAQGLIEHGDGSVLKPSSPKAQSDLCRASFLKMTAKGRSSMQSNDSLRRFVCIFDLPSDASVWQVVASLQAELEVHVQKACVIQGQPRPQHTSALIELLNEKQAHTVLDRARDQNLLFQQRRVDAVVLSAPPNWSKFSAIRERYYSSEFGMKTEEGDEDEDATSTESWTFADDSDPVALVEVTRGNVASSSAYGASNNRGRNKPVVEGAARISPRLGGE